MNNIHRNHRAEIPAPLWRQLEVRAVEKDTTPEYQLLRAIRMGLATQDALVSLVSRAADASGLWVPDPPDAQPVEEEDAG